MWESIVENLERVWSHFETKMVSWKRDIFCGLKMPYFTSCLLTNEALLGQLNGEPAGDLLQLVVLPSQKFNDDIIFSSFSQQKKIKIK